MEEKKHEVSHEHHEHSHAHEHHGKPKIKKIQMWQIATGVLGLLFIASIFTNGFNSSCGTAGALSAQEAADKAVTFLNANVLEGATATAGAVEEKEGLYNIKLNIAGREYDSYVTKDAKLLFPSGIDMTEEVPAASTQQQQAAQNLPKTAKPKIDLYIMSYCPYGLQAQQGMYPVAELLGNSIEFNVKWVPYAMHGRKEVDENTRQYCIQKEQKSKYVAYMGCFSTSTDASSCGEEAGIDEDMVAACIEEANEEFKINEDYDAQDTWLSGRFPIYRVDKEEADALGVRGSPTIFINGVQYGGARTPEAYKAAICGAFTNAPSACGSTLSSTAAAASGSCG